MSALALIAYVPSPHRGYVELFRKYAGNVLYVLGPDIICEFPSLTRNLPANDPYDVQRMLVPMALFKDIRILTKQNVSECGAFGRIVMPDEDVSRALAEKFFGGVRVEFDGSWRLRWDRGAVLASKVPDGTTITADAFNRDIMRSAQKAAARSPDWWRQVGAVLVRDGKVQRTAYNRHVPSEQSAYLFGDPRSNFDAGEGIEYSTALHAEAAIIAEAAQRGFSMEGCDLYVTTFPCPPCAYSVARTRIKRLFYADGYSRLEGADELKRQGVELIRVV